MEIETRIIDDIPILTPHGDLRGDDENQEFHRELLKLIVSKPHAVVLDMANVRFMVSAALGLLVGAFHRANEHGVRILFANSQKRVSELLFVTHLEKYLKDYGTVEEAVIAARDPKTAPPPPPPLKDKEK